MSGAALGWAGPDGLEIDGEARNLAYFVTAHGYGHATRASAVMAAVRRRMPHTHFHVFTQAPEWIFADTVGQGFSYHSAVTDVGLVQASVLTEDLEATLQRLDDFLPFDPQLVRHWADWVLRLGCQAVVCDIAPLGLTVAQAAGLPSVLIENFTWDWIYTGYLEQAPRLAPHIEALRDTFALADHRLQSEPLCAPSAQADARLPPIARAARQERAATRAALGIGADERMVLVTLGGLAATVTAPPATSHLADVVYVIPGGAADSGRADQRLVVPPHSAFFHPDLIAASDVVIGKVGYSTVAETYHAGVPFGFLARAQFRESPVMAEFVRREMHGVEIPAADFEAGVWEPYVEQLLQLPRGSTAGKNGAEQAADYVAAVAASAAE